MLKHRKQIKLSGHAAQHLSGFPNRLRNHLGEVIHVGTAPTTVDLKASRGFFKPARYTIDFQTTKGQKQSVVLNAAMDGWYLGNLVFGGLIGFLIVDPLTGAMWRLNKEVVADFHSGTTNTAMNGSRQLRILDRSTIPNEWEGKLVPIVLED